MAYTNQQLIENYLQRSLTENEIALLFILNRAIKIWIDTKTNSCFDQVSETTRVYEGGTSSIDIDPCTDINQVSYLNNDGTNSYDYVSGTEYLAEPTNMTVKREIRKRVGCFPDGQSRIAVRAKFSEWVDRIPEDIQIIATRLAGDVISMSEQANTANVESEELEGHKIKFRDVNELVDKTAMDDPFVRSMLDLRKEIYI